MKLFRGTLFNRKALAAALDRAAIVPGGEQVAAAAYWSGRFRKNYNDQ